MSTPAGAEDLEARVRRGEIGAVLNVVGATRVNALQRAAVERSRLGIPLLFGLDVVHGYRTIFPVPLATAASVDLALIERGERATAREATAAGVRWTFAPMVDVARDPRWGRIVEGAGEAPFLGVAVAAARVRGFQGSDLAASDSLVACVKHYVAHGAAQGGRDYDAADISEQTLREVHLPPFAAAVRAGAGTLMAAFNDGGVLPIAASARTIAVIGPFADAPGEQLGVWAAEARAADSVTPLAAIVARTAGRRVLHSTGVSVASLVPPSASGSGGKPPAPNSAIGVAGSGAATGPVSIEHAAAAARDADVELLFLGEPALADVLLGDAAPSGRLPVSWPRSVGQIPVFFGHKSTGRPMTADRWHTGYQYESSAPLYPFGHGLTYTSFGYSNLRITPATLSAGGTVTVSADLANEGKRADTEVVQLYVRDRVASTTRPVRELEGFARVTLAAGERRTVELPLAAAELSCFDPEGGWTPGDGEFDVWVGPDAASGLHATLEVAAPAAP